MTPKEKAKKLYDKMLSAKKSDYAAKESALIAVDEIQRTLWNAAAGGRVQIKNSDENLEYWEHVKEEIESL